MRHSRKSAHRLVAVWFADIVGYSRLASENERAAYELVKQFQSAARESVGWYGGRLVKFMGDGAMAEFPGTEEAVRAADALQRKFGAKAGAARLDNEGLRIGVHVGDVTVADDGDLYGDGVNITARIQREAVPGQILVSEEVRRQLTRRPGFQFEALGPRELKGVLVPIEVFAVVVQGGVQDGMEQLELPDLRRRAFAVGGATILIGLIALGAFSRFDPSAGGKIDSIAVLPFLDMSTGGDQEYFSHGISEDVLNALAQVQGLEVASRTLSFQFEGPDIDVREVGRELEVGAVLEGSVRKSGQRLLVTVQLVRANDGLLLWSETYDRGAVDVFAIQEEITRSIVVALQLRLPGGLDKPLVANRTQDLEAYDLYLRGRQVSRAGTKEGLERAVEYFGQVVARDPSIAQSHAGLADAYVRLASYRHMPAGEALPRARAEAEQALALDGTLAEPHATLGLVHHLNREWEASLQRYERATALKPSNPTAHHWRAIALAQLGRREEAQQEIERAAELDPLDPAIQTTFATLLYFSGEYNEAQSKARRAVELGPTFWGSQIVLSRIYAAKDRPDEALPFAERASTLAPGNPIASAQLAKIYVLFGDRREARRILAEIQNAQDQCASCVAEVYAALGDVNRAFLWFDQAAREPLDAFSFARLDPFYNILRSDPRFDRLIAKLVDGP